MFENVHVPVLGVVENMAYFTPPDLPDRKYFLFGEAGAQRLAVQSQRRQQSRRVNADSRSLGYRLRRLPFLALWARISRLEPTTDSLSLRSSFGRWQPDRPRGPRCLPAQADAVTLWIRVLRPAATAAAILSTTANEASSFTSANTQ